MVSHKNLRKNKNPSIDQRKLRMVVDRIRCSGLEAELQGSTIKIRDGADPENKITLRVYACY